MKNIISRYPPQNGKQEYIDSYVTSGTYHDSEPQFVEEVCFRIPLELSAKHHVYLQFFQISMSNDAKNELKDKLTNLNSDLPEGQCDDSSSVRLVAHAYIPVQQLLTTCG